MSLSPVLPDPLPWYVAGPLFGLAVVAIYALLNDTLGVSGTYFQVARLIGRRPHVDVWRVAFWCGLVGGTLTAAALRGGPAMDLGYGALTALLPFGAAVPCSSSPVCSWATAPAGRAGAPPATA